MNLILEVGLTWMLSIANTPYADRRPAQISYLLIEKKVTENFSVAYLNSTRNNIRRLNQFDPITTAWQVEGRYEFQVDDGILTVGLGHKSEHEISAVDKLTESYDFASVKYRLEY